MEALIVISVISIVVFLAVRANRKDKNDREIPDVKPPVVVEPIPDPEIPPVVVEPKHKIYDIDIKDDGTDQTNYIREQLSKVENGTNELRNIIQFPKGRYWTEGDMENNPRGRNGVFKIVGLENVDIIGNETIFYTKAPAVPYGSSVSNNSHSQRRHFWFRECKNLNVTKIRVEGSNTIDGRSIGTTPELTPEFWKGGKDDGSISGSPAYKSYWEAEHAFDFRDCTNCGVDNVEVFGVWGDGVYAGADISQSKNIYVKNSHFKFTGRQGFAAANNVDGLLIENNWFDLGRRASIDFEPHNKHGYVRNAIVRNNKLHAVQVPIAALGNGDVSNIQILDNEFSGGSFIIAGDSNKIVPHDRHDWIIRGNKRTNWFGSPMASSSFFHTRNIIFENNTEQVSSKQSRNSIIFDRCKGENIVRNNDFSGGRYIQLRDTESVIVEGNIPKQELIQLNYI